MSVEKIHPWPVGTRTTLTIGQDRIKWLWQEGQSEGSNMSTVCSDAIDAHRRRAEEPEPIKGSGQIVAAIAVIEAGLETGNGLDASLARAVLALLKQEGS